MDSKDMVENNNQQKHKVEQNSHQEQVNDVMQPDTDVWDKYAIIVNHLSLMIKKDRILSNITLQLERGKIHGMIGRNGSGKTMLMKCIYGFVRQTSGTVHVDLVPVTVLSSVTRNKYISLSMPFMLNYIYEMLFNSIIADLNISKNRMFQLDRILRPSKVQVITQYPFKDRIVIMLIHHIILNRRCDCGE